MFFFVISQRPHNATTTSLCDFFFIYMYSLFFIYVVTRNIVAAIMTLVKSFLLGDVRNDILICFCDFTFLKCLLPCFLFMVVTNKANFLILYISFTLLCRELP